MKHTTPTAPLKVFVIALFWLPTFALAQKADGILHNIVGLDTRMPSNRSAQKTHIKSIYDILTYLGQLEAEEKRFNGEVSFSFNGDDGLAQRMFVFGAGLKLQKGTYPGEFKFNYNSGLTLTNDRISENISNIFASYDFHPAFTEDRLAHEFFGFINRFSDAYLSVDLRYEIGGGYLIQAWSKNDLVQKGEKSQKKITPDHFKPGTDAAREHMMSLKNHYANNGIKASTFSADSIQVNELQKKMTCYSIKKYARFRTGILLGLFFEFEKITLKDTLRSNGLKESINHAFNPTHKIRYEVRPFFQWRFTDGIEFNWDTYFKMPMFGYERNIVRSANGAQESNLRDIRIDSEISLTMTLSPPEIDDKSVSASLIYNHYYDEAPQRYFTPFLDSNGLQILHAASRHHHQFRMKFGIQF